jgi:anti-anti-sigma regulatory factor
VSDSDGGTATGLQPGTIQLDSALTVSCSTGQAGDTILTFAGELDAVSADQAYRYVRDTIDARGGAGHAGCGGPELLRRPWPGRAPIRMSSRARQAGSFLYLLTPPPRFVRLSRITGLDEELLVHRGERTGEVALARARHHRCE